MSEIDFSTLRGLANESLVAEVTLGDDCSCSVSGTLSFVDSGRALVLAGGGSLQIPLEEIEGWDFSVDLWEEGNASLDNATGVPFATIKLHSGISIRLKRGNR